MNQKNQPTPLELLRAKRKNVLRLSELQIELRRAFVARLEKDGVPLGTAAAKANVPWKCANELAQGERAFGPSDTLKSLVAYCGRQDLFKEFERAAEHLNDRLVGVSILSPKAIGLVFDVHETYLNECPEDATYALFAAAFDGMSDLILGILTWRIEDMRRLEDETAADKLESILLSDDLTHKLTSIMAAYHEQQATLSAELRRLAEQLLGGQVVKCKLTKLLGAGPSNIGYALEGKVPPARLEEFIALAKEKLAQRESRAKPNGKTAEKPRDAAPKANNVAKPKSDRPKASDNPSMEPANRLKAIISRLRTVYGSEPRLAQDLKTSLNTLHDAMNGRMGVEATNNMVERAQRLADTTFPTRPLTTAVPGRIGSGGQSRFRGQEDPALAAPAAPKPAAPTPVSPVPPTSEPDARPPSEKPKHQADTQNANLWPVGRTSDEGIPFTLDEVAFRPISLRPSPDELKSVAVQIQLVRAWLNALAQISDHDIRAQVRQALSHEIEELGITLRIFTDEFPNRMIGLYDAERQTMHALGMDSDSRSKKGNR